MNHLKCSFTYIKLSNSDSIEHGSAILMNFHDFALLKKYIRTLASVTQLVGALSYKLKGHRFNSWSKHIPRLQVWSPGGTSANK